MDWKYSLVACKDPWPVNILDDKTYNALSLDDKTKCVNIHDRSLWVQKALKSSKSYGYMCTYHASTLPDVPSKPTKEEHEYYYYKVSYKGNANNIGYVDPKLAFICLDGAEAIAELWRANDPMRFEIKSTVAQWYKLKPSQLQYMYGVLHLSLNSNLESHAFVLDMRVDTIIVYNSYGGTDAFFITEFSRREWLKWFITFPNQSIKYQKHNYHVLWGFDAEMVRPYITNLDTSLVYEALTYTRVF
jgi:hypothetical protein